MLMARAILGLIMVTTAVGAAFLMPLADKLVPALLGLVILVTMFVAAVTVLVITFVEFEERNGRFMLDTNSWIARAMGGYPGKKITICLLFWVTVLLVMIVALVVLLAVVGVMGLFVVGWWQGLINVLTVAAGFALIGSFIFGMNKLENYSEKSPRVKTAVKVAEVSVLVIVGAFVLLVFGWGVYKMGVWKFLIGLGVVVLSIGAVVGLIFLAFKLFKSLGESTVGKVLSSGWHYVKSRTCPVVSVVELK